MAACPSCGEANPARARFCLACGTALSAPREPPAEMRKTVTVVFCDVVDSTPLGEQLDAETYRRVISRYFIEASRVFERHGGTVEKFIGDAVMAVFGIPVVHEDDALRAVRAAAELREAIAGLNADLRPRLGIELGVRVGVDTGEVVAGDAAEGQAFATGETVVVAQRLEAAASSGEILIGASTHHLVRDAVLVEPVRLELKGLGAREAWRLLGVVAGAPAFARQLDRPLVGRERELSLLEHAFQRAVEERSCHLFTVFGAAGVGKSRLVNEFVTGLGDEAQVLTGRCVPYGEGMTFWPLREMIREAAAIGSKTPPAEARGTLAYFLEGDPDAEAVAEVLTAVTGIAEGESTTEETLWALRKLVERRALERPHALVFDDVQWAEPAFLDLVDQLAQWTRDAPVLIVCLARPELLEEHPGWGGGKVNASSIQLEPLRGEVLDRLIENLLEGAAVPPETLETLRAAGDGNPLFVEEMLAMLVDQGRLKQDDGGWRETATVGPIEAPPTIQALLAARIDRLDEGERDVLGRASVIGKTFSREALGALVSAEQIDACLPALDRKDLIRPELGQPADEVYRFRHILIRDAAYNALPKELRSDLHARLADWLAVARPEREFEEVLGFHLEQAHRYHFELSDDTGELHVLAARAARHLAAAGRRAIGRGDHRGAAGLLTRATLLLRDDDRARVELSPDLALALTETGELEQAVAILEHAIEDAERIGDEQLVLRAKLESAIFRGRRDPDWEADELRRLAEEAKRVFEPAEDHAGLMRVWFALSLVHLVKAQWAERAAALEHVLRYARLAGARREEANAIGALALTLTWGPTPVAEAIARCEEMLSQVEGEMRLRTRVLVALAELHALEGDFDKARRLYSEAKTVAQDHGLQLLAALQTLTGGTIELLAGDALAAEAELRWGYETLRRMGEKLSFSTNAALLAEALYRQDRVDEAETLTQVGEESAPPDDVASQTWLRGTKAKILVRRGEAAAAEHLAREAVALAERADAMTLRGDSLLALSEVLRICGRGDEARAAADQARSVYERKGNVAAARLAAEAVAAPAPTR